MICLVVINLVNYPNVVAVEVTDSEGNLIKAREENSRGGIGWDNRFTEDVLDSIMVGTTAVSHRSSFRRYGSQARGTYEIQKDSSGLCTIRIYEYDHTTNKTEIYRRVLDDITNDCEIELWYVGNGKIEVIVNNIQLASKRFSDEAQYRSREVARGYITLAQEGIESRGSFSQIRGTLSLGRPENWYHPNHRLEETRIPTDTALAEVSSGGNKRSRCTIL